MGRTGIDHYRTGVRANVEPTTARLKHDVTTGGSARSHNVIRNAHGGSVDFDGPTVAGVNSQYPESTCDLNAADRLEINRTAVPGRARRRVKLAWTGDNEVANGRINSDRSASFICPKGEEIGGNGYRGTA